jgi:hypothetical protein
LFSEYYYKVDYGSLSDNQAEDKSVSHLRRLGNQISIRIRTDKHGYVGRECPACKSYFKVTPATGITTGNPPCHCPYCGKAGSPNEFVTKDQIRYARSVGFNKITEAVLRDLKEMEFDIKPRGAFGFGMSMKVEGRPHPIRCYQDPKLETEVVCDHCTLRFAIYGVFAFCPDCGQHNSVQILNKNLDLVEKHLALAEGVEGDLSAQLVSDALENVVAAFDGFGREICRLHASKATNPSQAESISFQNLAGAQKNLQALFGFDLAPGLPASDWDALSRSFQKRHVLAHSMGIVDEKYLTKTSDPHAKRGRKVPISSNEVSATVGLARTMGAHLAKCLRLLG